MGFSAWIYLRRELPISGWRVLAILRALTLVGVLLLLANPDIPGSIGRGSGQGVPWILVDGSASMAAVGASRETAWADAVEHSAALGGGEVHLATFGGGTIGPEPAILGGPNLRTSRLAPALDRAIEAGASQISVITDMRISDPSAVVRRVEAGLVPIRFEPLGPGRSRNAGIGRVDVAVKGPGGDSISFEVTVFSEGVTDSLAVTLLEEGQPLTVLRVGPVAPGRESVFRTTVAAPAGGGSVRYSARVDLADDQFALDDRREALVDIDPVGGGVVLISFTADWEPRFLLPVLAQVTGLTPIGFVLLGDGRFLSIEAGPNGGGIGDGDEVRRRAERAELLVVHGAGSDLPEWVSDAALAAGRVVVFADDAEGASVFGLQVSPAGGGEWYPSSDPTASALAGVLSGIPWGTLPPLTGLLLMGAEGVGDVPLRIQLQGSGSAEPALLLTSAGVQRRAMVLARGYWRWAFRAGPAREAYRRLWSAVGGWLLANEPLSGGPGIRPVEAVMAANVTQKWWGNGFAGEDLRITIREAAEIVSDTVVAVGDPESFDLPDLPEGDYSYEARGADGAPLGEGRFLVDPYSGDMGVPTMVTPEATTADAGGGGVVDPPGRSLRTHPLPYLTVLALMCAEWVFRRRRGLR